MHARDVVEQLEALAGSREDFATLTYDLTDSWLARLRRSRASRAIACVRVSSRAQDHATQRSVIERAADARGDEIEARYAENRSARNEA